MAREKAERLEDCYVVLFNATAPLADWFMDWFMSV